MINFIKEIDKVPADLFGIYKYYEEDVYVLWPHNLKLLYNKNNAHTLNNVTYIPFIYRNKQVLIK